MASSYEAARDLLGTVAKCLADAGVDAALIGGQAVNAWVEPRLTMDIDITIVSGAEARAVTDTFRAAGFTIVTQQDWGSTSGPDFVRFLHGPTGVEVDVQVAKTSFETGVVTRARRDSGVSIPVATAEDLVVLKLIASRRKDMRDLLDLGALPGLDWTYIEQWAETWEVAERLRQLREWLREDEERLRDLYS